MNLLYLARRCKLTDVWQTSLASANQQTTSAHQAHHRLKARKQPQQATQQQKWWQQRSIISVKNCGVNVATL